MNTILDYLRVFNNINKRPAYKPRTMAQGGRIGFGKGSTVAPITAAKEKDLKVIFDTIFETKDWGGIKGDVPNLSRQEIDAGIKKYDPSRKGKTGGKIPNQWFSQHVSKAIKGDVDALNDLARITGRSVEDLQGAFGKIKGAKQIVRSVAAAKSHAGIKQVNIDFIDLLKKGTTKKEDFKKLLKITEDEFQDTVAHLFKKSYSDRSKLKGGKIKNSYLGSTIEDFDALVGDDGLLKKIEGVTVKTNQRNSTAMIELVFGVDGTHPNPKMFEKMKGRINEYYKLTKELADKGIILNLDHTIPITLIDAIQDSKLGAKPLKANFQAISQALNMGIKNKFDTIYADSYKFGDEIVTPTKANRMFKNPSNLTGKELMKAIDEVATAVGMPMGKVGDNMLNLGSNPYLTGDMKQMIYNNLVAQNQMAGKAKKLDPALLKKAGLDNLNFDVARVDTELVAKLFSKGDANFADFLKNKRLISSGSGGVSFMGAGAFDDVLKSKAVKKGLSAFRKVGGPWEVGFIGLDFINNLDTMDANTAFQTALSNATLGMYEGGKRAQWKDFETAGKELGHNPENLNEIKSMLDLEKMLAGEKEVLKEMIAYNAQEGTGEGLQGEFSQEEIEWRKEVVARLEKEFENKQNTFWSKDNAQDLAKNYHDTIGYIARKEYNKNWEKKKTKVNPEMGPIGSPLWQVITDWKDYVPQSLLPQNFLQNAITKAIPNTLRKLPGVLGDVWEPTSERAKLYDMSDEERAQRAKDLNIQEQYYHPVTGSTMTQGQMEPYYEKFYSGGGIASLMKK